MAVASGGECTKTHLMCVSASGQRAFRIAKRSYGSMNPVKRTAGADVGSWGRFDVVGHRTIYGASPVEAAYGESLAAYRRALSLRTTRLRDLFDPDGETDGDMPLDEAIGRDWDDADNLPLGSVAASWRDDRLIYALTLPTNGYFIDLEHAGSLQAVSDGMGAVALAAVGHTGYLDVGDLRGKNRALTTAIAGWVWNQTLVDGSRPHGIVFGSKHDSDWRCWAIWLRRVDDGRSVAVEPTRSDAGSTIPPTNRNDPLKTVADTFKLIVH